MAVVPETKIHFIPALTSEVEETEKFLRLVSGAGSFFHLLSLYSGHAACLVPSYRPARPSWPALGSTSPSSQKLSVSFRVVERPLPLAN